MMVSGNFLDDRCSALNAMQMLAFLLTPFMILIYFLFTQLMLATVYVSDEHINQDRFAGVLP